MTKFLQIATVFAFCCFLHFRVAVGKHPGTNFTKAPPGTVFGNLGSDVTFHWKLNFGDNQDWRDFKEIYWGRTDNNKNIRNKYITVSKNGKISKNSGLPNLMSSRVYATGNITQHGGCSVVFVLRKVTRSDQLITYGCTADVNGDEVKSGPIRLVVQVPPSITNRSNSTIDVEDGDDVKLQCDATGDPTPFIEWWKDGALLRSSNTATEFLIANIELKDAGNYVCTAQNRAGSVSYITVVRVLRYRPHINKTASSDAVIESWLSHVTSLTCAVDANPTANFTWFKDGRPILGGVNSLHNVGTLTLTPTTAGHFGLYSCKAMNIKGTAWHNVTLHQLHPPGRPVISKLVPDMLSISVTWNKSRDNGGSSILDYKITLLDVNSNVQRIQSGLRESYYTIQNLKQNRTYTIALRARNVVGYSESSNTTVSTLEADPPRILSVSIVPHLLAVNISWNSTNDNNGIKILDYRIILVDTTTQQKRKFTGIKVSTLYVTRLMHNRTYVVHVQARNEDGYGRSKSRNVTTLEADPPGPPMIKAIPRVFSLEISWNSSDQDANNIKLLDYRITLTDGTTLKQVFTYTAITRTSLVIVNLARNRTYIAEIQARNEVGYGKTANVTATTLLAGPPEPPSLINITVVGKKCSLQWAKPYNGESPIELYTVSVWVLLASNGSNYKERLNTWNTTEMEHTLELGWNQSYTTAVSAWNKYGQSFYGLERHFRTEKFPQELSSTSGTEALSTFPSNTEDSSSETSLTEYPYVTQVRTTESVSTEGSNRNSFMYLAPLWIVILAFAIPAAAFMLWKATQKVIVVYCCKRRPRSRRPRQFHNRDSESSVTTLDEVKEKTDTDCHYETITEILEMHFNHGFSTDDEKGSLKQTSIHGYNSVYNHLYETSLGSGLDVQQTPKITGHAKPTKLGHKQMESGLGMFPDHVYSHLIHGDSLNKRLIPVPNASFTVPSKCHWEIPRERLQLKRTIGCGEFGLVKKGLALNVSRNGGWIPVAVKTLKEDQEKNDLCRKDFLSELKVMKGLSPHQHVVQLLACITESEPLCVITEFAPYGDLLGFLRKKRGLKDAYYSIDQLPTKSLTSQRLMQFAWEIADGMAYLSSAKIIHRDLAARNVLLGENLTCKVTDFGLARNIRGQNMYQKNSGGRLPVKWTAIEALLHGLYTSKSDVWSFGVVLFEIATIGGWPYPGMDVLELIDKLEAGYRMEKPRHIAEELYAVMLSCWNENPDKRPTFLQLYSTLNKLGKENQVCINLRMYDGKLYENLQMPSK